LGVTHHKKKVWLKNRLRIIELLGQKPYRNKDLLRWSDVSPATLSSHLKQLLEEDKIEKITFKDKKGIYYNLLPGTLLNEIIVPEFVEFIGANVVEQILRLEMGLIDNIDLKKSFGIGTVESFVHRKAKNETVDYRKILDILKEKYGDWIELEAKEKF
jgi:DNA-binding transcriptional ArsR family regulator